MHEEPTTERAGDPPALLVLTSTYPRWAGDPEPGFVHELAKRLTGRFRVIVLGPHAPGARTNETLDGVEVVRYRYAPEKWETLVNHGGIVTNLRTNRWKALLVPGFVLSMAWNFLKLLRQHKVAVIHAHWLIPQGWIVAVLARLGLRVAPFVVTSHGADLFALRTWPFPQVKKFVVHRAAAVTVVSEGMRTEMESLGIDPENVLVEPMGVDLTGRFHPDLKIARSSSELLFVGRLVEKKGLRYLIEALPLIRAVRSDVCLTVAGFGPELEARRAQVHMLGLEGSVKFIGPVGQHELPPLYRRAALFVAPFVQTEWGDQDGLGLVLVEALGCGCPVVVSNLPATRGLSASCEAVCVVEPGDAVALSKAVLSALETYFPPQSDDVMSFDWGVRAAAYGDLLVRAMEEA